MFGADRNTRSDPHRAIITVATGKGGAIFGGLVSFVRSYCFSFADTLDALTLRFGLFAGDGSTRSSPCRAIITAAIREGGAMFDVWVVFVFKETLRYRGHCQCVV